MSSIEIPTLTTVAPVHKPARPGIAVIAVASLIAILYFGRVFLITLVIAAIIGFLLDPLVSALVKMRLPRPFASVIVCSFALAILYLSGLAIYTQLSGLAEDLPAYTQRISKLADSVTNDFEQFEKNASELFLPKRIQPALSPNAQRNARRNRPDPTTPPPIQEVRIHPEPTPIWSYLYGYVVSFYDTLLMASFVPFLVYFMLSWRDHLRRSFLYLFDGPERHVAGKAWEGVAEMARGYVLGNFVLGLMLSVITCVFFFIIKLPYWPIVGPLSGFLSLVPYVGLPLAIAPAILSGVGVFDAPGMYFLMATVVAILHLVAMNVLYPKVVGSRVHLNPLVVTIALMFWGTLWGGIGLLLAIPITAGIKAVCDNVSHLQGYGKLLGD